MARSKPNTPRPDGRSNNGRKKGTVVKKQPKVTPAKMNKAKEKRMSLYGTNAIIDEFGSEADFFKHLARESRNSFNHLKLLVEYTYGKPEDQNRNVAVKTAPTIVFMNGDNTKKEDIIDVTHENIENNTNYDEIEEDE